MRKPKRLRTLSVYGPAVRGLGKFRVTAPLPSSQSKLNSLGFETTPGEGDSIIPAPVGPITTYNANGRETVRRDLPKISEPRLIWTTWQDWHGQEHSGTQLRAYEVYQRELTPPPEEELCVLRSPNGLVLASRVFDVSKDSDEAIVHVFNLFLEILGEFEIVSPKLDSAPPLQVKRLKWRILPPGEYPFGRARQELTEFLQRLSDSERHLFEDRLRAVAAYNPDFMAIGLGGFRDYVVFGFLNRNVFILESPWLGNATYIFKNNWQDLSSLTKKQILDGSLHEARLIHSNSWPANLRKVVAGEM